MTWLFQLELTDPHHSVATGYGQPPSTVYDWTLAPINPIATSFQLPYEAEARLLIERFCNKVTKSIYTNENDPVGLTSDVERSTLTRILIQDLEDLETKIRGHGNPTCESAQFRNSSTHQPVSISKAARKRTTALE